MTLLAPSAAPTLPLLDLRQLESSASDRAAFLTKLRSSAHDVGFFYLDGHGVTPDEFRDLFLLVRRFFYLPEAEKRAIDMVNSPHFRGYTGAGQEITRGRADWREQFDIGAERPALPRAPDRPPWSRLQGPNQWPAHLPELRDGLLAWQAAMTDVGVRLLRAFAEALGQPPDAFESIFVDAPNQHIKAIRYPGRDTAPDDQGVGAHKDSGFLTLLAQDGRNGLQVETANGWIDARPPPGVFIINIGELLELATNGYLRATVHRVVTPPAGTDRLSVAFFFGARLDATIPLLTLPPELAVEARGPARDPLNPLFAEVGFNYLKGRLRSHPDVARRHHADLLE